MRSQLMWRITAPVMALSLLLMAVGTGAAWNVHKLHGDVSRTLSEKLERVIVSEKLVLTIRDTRVELDRFERTKDANFLPAALSNRQRLIDMARGIDSEAHADVLRQFEANHRAFFDQLERVSQRASDADADEIADIVSAVSALRREMTETLLGPASQILEENREAATRQSARNQVLAGRIGGALFLLGICGASGGLLAGYGIARGVTRSITQLNRPMHEMAEKLNEVGASTAITPHTDLWQMGSAMRRLADKTTNVVDQLRDTQQQMMRTEQLVAVGRLAAGLAHELRNPLTSIKLLVQTAAEREAGLQGRDLQVLEEEIVRLETMLQTFLDFARPPQLCKTQIDLKDVVEQTVELARARGESQGIRIVLQADDAPPALEADLQQIRQIVLNLLLNAFDALPHGGSIQVSLGYRSEDEAEALIVVADDGPGLPAELGGQIFEPFVSTKETGIGLGLSICHRIVESHGGSISAEDRPEGGAQFTVRLPATAACLPMGSPGN